MKVKQNETEEYVSSEREKKKKTKEVEIIDLTDKEAKAIFTELSGRMDGDRQVIQKSCDKMRSTIGRNSNPRQYSSWENHMDIMNRQKKKNMTLDDKSSRSEGVQYATREEQRAIINSSRRNEATESKWK